MIVAVTGHKGRIGSLLVGRGYIPLDCDITDVEQVHDTVSDINPDVIIHCAAMADVGWCEENEKEAYKVNVRGIANILEFFKGRFIFLSTVHVFNGRKYFSYSEKHEPDPVNVYGLTKFAGEVVSMLWGDNTTTIRISKTFDLESMKPTIDTLQTIHPDDGLEITTLIKRSFIYTPHLVEGISWVAENSPDVDLLNISGTDTLSYYNFWLQAANILGLDEKRIIPRKYKIDDYPRPFRGGLNVRKAKKLGVPLYSAVDGLKVIKENMK